MDLTERIWAESFYKQWKRQNEALESIAKSLEDISKQNKALIKANKPNNSKKNSKSEESEEGLT